MASHFGYFYSNTGWNILDLEIFFEALETLAIELNKESSHVNLYLNTPYGLKTAFSTNALDDLKLVQLAIVLVSTYCIMFLGSFSPVHFRSVGAVLTLICVGLSYAASYGFSSLVGFKSIGLHNLLPFLLIGIGVDNMFVVPSSIDQTDTTLPVPSRIKIGMMHAGTSITITSMTSVIAFLLGSTGSLDAMASFCFFAATGIFCLYFSTITIFAAFMVWDLKRQHN